MSNDKKCHISSSLVTRVLPSHGMLQDASEKEVVLLHHFQLTELGAAQPQDWDQQTVYSVSEIAAPAHPQVIANLKPFNA